MLCLQITKLACNMQLKTVYSHDCVCVYIVQESDFTFCLRVSMKMDNIRAAFIRKVPILQWLPKYDGQTALADLIAGITVGLTLIPQSIAYAALANLSPQVKSKKPKGSCQI